MSWITYFCKSFATILEFELLSYILINALYYTCHKSYFNICDYLNLRVNRNYWGRGELTY